MVLLSDRHDIIEILLKVALNRNKKKILKTNNFTKNAYISWMVLTSDNSVSRNEQCVLILLLMEFCYFIVQQIMKVIE